MTKKQNVKTSSFDQENRVFNHGDNLKTNLEILAQNLEHLAKTLGQNGDRPLEGWELDLGIMASKQALEAMMDDMPKTASSDRGREDNNEFFERMHMTVEDLRVLIEQK